MLWYRFNKNRSLHLFRVIMKSNLTFTFCWLKFTMFHFGCQLSRYSKDITVETQSGLENWPKASPGLTIPHDVMGAPPDGAVMTSWGRHMTAPPCRHEGATWRRRHDVRRAPHDGAPMTSWRRHMTAPSWRHDGASHDDSGHRWDAVLNQFHSSHKTNIKIVLGLICDSFKTF